MNTLKMAKSLKQARTKCFLTVDDVLDQDDCGPAEGAGVVCDTRQVGGGGWGGGDRGDNFQTTLEYILQTEYNILFNKFGRFP